MCARSGVPARTLTMDIVRMLPRRLLCTRHLINTLCVPPCFPISSVPLFPQSPRVSALSPSMSVSAHRMSRKYGQQWRITTDNGEDK